MAERVGARQPAGLLSVPTDGRLRQPPKGGHVRSRRQCPGEQAYLGGIGVPLLSAWTLSLSFEGTIAPSPTAGAPKAPQPSSMIRLSRSMVILPRAPERVGPDYTQTVKLCLYVFRSLRVM